LAAFYKDLAARAALLIDPFRRLSSSSKKTMLAKTLQVSTSLVNFAQCPNFR
jgi:hypothetical protein